ncbi:divalent-cation tolerance protein CutA [Candidatus Altiarchaeota archaeon]
MTDYCVIYTTTPTEEMAKKIAEALVSSHLVACVNYYPANSVYYWKGQVMEEKEHILMCKTLNARFKEIEAKIKAIHSYECPEILALKITNGSRDYLNWVFDSTKQHEEGVY